MDKAIVTVLLVIVSVTCVVFIFNTFYPAVTRSSGALADMAGGMDERLKSQVEIIHAMGYTDDDYALVWVKNIGSARIGAIDQSDIFFGPAVFSRPLQGRLMTSKTCKINELDLPSRNRGQSQP